MLGILDLRFALQKIISYYQAYYLQLSLGAGVLHWCSTGAPLQGAASLWGFFLPHSSAWGLHWLHGCLQAF